MKACRVFRAMNRYISPLFFLLVAVIGADGQEANGTSTVTFGLGAGRPVSYNYGVGGGPQLNGSYEYRFLRHWAAEFGVDTTHVKTGIESVTVTAPGSATGVTNTASDTYSYTYSKTNALATSMPFGLRGILPLAQGRLELFGGGGGAYLWNPGVYGNNGGWGWQASLGARLAVDQKRRYWFGTSGRYVHANGGYPPRWIVWTADPGFRFGH